MAFPRVLVWSKQKQNKVGIELGMPNLLFMLMTITLSIPSKSILVNTEILSTFDFFLVVNKILISSIIYVQTYIRLSILEVRLHIFYIQFWIWSKLSLRFYLQTLIQNKSPDIYEQQKYFYSLFKNQTLIFVLKSLEYSFVYANWKNECLNFKEIYTKLLQIGW